MKNESEPRRIPFEGVRIRYDSEKSSDEMMDALLSDVGTMPVSIDEIGSTSADWDTYRARVQSHVGPGGFMLFGIFNHGGWLAKAGIERKVVRLIIGNPLIAITMLRHDVTAGLFAPVELLVMDEDALNKQAQPTSSGTAISRPPARAAPTPAATTAATPRRLGMSVA